MAANPPTGTRPTTSSQNNLYAAADLGTNSFKLLIVHFDPTTNRFLPLHHLKHPVLLTRHTSPSASLSSPTISLSSQLLALNTLREFHHVLTSLSVHPARTRLVATSALREAPNQSEFVNAVRQTLGLEIDVISGEEEARLIYKGVLQFHPVFNKTVLNIDIGGGSTEFVIGREGKVIYANSLRLGHVGLTEEFVERNEIGKMREHVRSVILQSGVVERIGEIGFEVVTGSSGTIRAIENAVFNRYCEGLVGEGYKLDWSFRRGELGEVVGKLSSESGGEGKERGVFEEAVRVYRGGCGVIGGDIWDAGD